MGDIQLYGHYFPPGKKVGVGIPLANAEVFHDWAIINKVDEDLVALQLSRDVLPAGVTLDYGQILELRGEVDNSNFCCRAIVVSDGSAHRLLLRLIGEIVSDELREFYRVDAFLPIKYFITATQNIDQLQKEWKARTLERQRRELDREAIRWNGELLSSVSHLPQEPLEGREDGTAACSSPGSGTDCDLANDWETIIPLAANISGGGLRILTHQGFALGEYILLELLVPIPQRLIEVIGRVVFASRNYAAGYDTEYFNTGVQFVHIDERDRDAVVEYISAIQLKRIRQMRASYLFRGNREEDELSGVSSDDVQSKNSGSFLKKVVAMLMLLFLVGVCVWFYGNNQQKGEIERSFEDALRNYQKR